MIARAAIEQRVREWGLRHGVVEKDYVLGWLLWGIGRHPVLGQTWIFKGGTCLKKCYIETYRFSEDLDFTIVEGGPIDPVDVAPLLDEVLQAVSEESGIDFSDRTPALKTRKHPGSVEGRVYYRGPLAAPAVASVNSTFPPTELLAREPERRPIAHPYEPDEALPGQADVACYAFEEVFAEKLRAMGERSRPRDLSTSSTSTGATTCVSDETTSTRSSSRSAHIRASKSPRSPASTCPASCPNSSPSGRTCSATSCPCCHRSSSSGSR